MKKVILKIASIVAAFLLGIVCMSYYLSAGNQDLTDSMADATLPLIYLEQGGRSLNLLHGYTQPMEGSYMRDAVLPIPEDRTLELRIECPDAEVEKIFYEVRSLDTTRLVEDTEVTDYTREDDLLHAKFQLKDLLESGEEYLLVLRLELEKGQEVCYYTHLSNLSESHLQECLDFVDVIHNALFDKENTVSIEQYLESDSSMDNNNLAHVNIHSRYRQMIWGDMEVKLSSVVNTYITEIESSIASVRLEYQVSYQNENAETERYEVQESYRVRYTKQRMYLLNYERTVNRIFDPKLSVFGEKQVMLGILNDSIEYRKNAEENIVGFVQNGELWCYDAAQNKLSYVFGFRDGDDLRCSYNQHAIKIMDIDETGSMNFLVYGYMNRGQHEGRTGIAVYSYDALTNSVEKRVFIESNQPFAALETELGSLAYVNQQGQFYLYLNGNICRIDLNTREYEEVVSDISEECCMVSRGNKFVAWQKEGALYASESIEILDMETGARRSIQAKEGFYLQALGFMDTDLIYGEARKEDIQKDITGKTIFPMGYVTIQGEDGEVIRECPYEEQGKYVVSCSIESNRISLECVTRNAAGGYEEAMPEPITYTRVETVEKIALETRNSTVKKLEYCFTLAEGRAKSKLKSLTPKYVLFEENRNLNLEKQSQERNYYVYAFDGTFVGAYRAPDEAVRKAYDHMGVVVNGSQDYIWKRGGRKTRVQISGFENPQEKPGESRLQAALESLLGYQKIYTDTAAYLEEGYTPYEILNENLNGEVLDLSGCSVSMVLYYVSQGYPILALEGNAEAELITGYDTQNIILTDPLTGESYKKGMNDSTQMFEGLGNLFLVCLPEKES